MLWDEGAQLEPTPRHIPWSVKIRLCLGGVGTKVSCFIGGFGLMVCALMFSPAAVWIQLQLYSGTVFVMGTTTGWSETTISVNELPIIANHYEFEFNNRIYENVSYFADKGLDADTPVRIKVKADSPDISVIDGARATRVGLVFLFILLCLPLVCSLVVLYIISKGLKRIRLLRHGIETEGVVIESVNTHITVNDETLYKVTIKYEGIDGLMHELTTRTSDVDELTDEPKETILMHPNRVGVAIPIDILPDYVHLTRDDGFSNGWVWGTIEAIGNLVLPVLIVA